jgi:hypothetical protein
VTLPVIAYINIASNFLPIGAGLYKHSWLRNDRILLIVILCLGSITEVLSLYLAIRHFNNLWLLNFYNLVEFVLLAALFSTWQRGRTKKMAVYTCILLYTAFWIIAKATFEPFAAPLEFTRTGSSIVFGILSVLTLFGLLN